MSADYALSSPYPVPRRGLNLDELDSVRLNADAIVRDIIPRLGHEIWHAGMAWYLDANLWCRSVAAEYGLDSERVAWALALLSPQNQWEQNRRDLIHLIESGDCGALPLGVDRAWSCVNYTGHGPDIAGGRKVRAFGRNLAYPHSSMDVTLDSHMSNLLRLPPRYLKRRGIYDTLSDVIRARAELHGVLPHQLQAALWLWQR